MPTHFWEQTEKNQMKLKFIVRRTERSYLSNEEIHKKHWLKILLASAAKAQ